MRINHIFSHTNLLLSRKKADSSYIYAEIVGFKIKNAYAFMQKSL